MAQTKIDQLLSDNNFNVVKTPEGHSSLMKAVSLAVFSTVEHHDLILKYCQKHLQSLNISKKLTSKLESFIQSKQWLEDYKANPSMKCFERMNLELISLVFKSKINVFSVSIEQQCLKAVIYNNGFEESAISLLQQPDQKHFHVIHPNDHNKSLQPFILDPATKSEILGDSQQQQQQQTLQQQMQEEDYDDITKLTQNYDAQLDSKSIYKVMEDTDGNHGVDSAAVTPIKQNTSYINHSSTIERETGSSTTQTHRQSFSRRHKKSLSDTFNPFQVRVPNEFFDFFRGSNDFTSNSASFMAFQSSSTSTNSNAMNNNPSPNDSHYQMYNSSAPAIDSMPKRIKSTIVPSVDDPHDDDILGIPRLVQHHSYTPTTNKSVNNTNNMNGSSVMNSINMISQQQQQQQQQQQSQQSQQNDLTAIDEKLQQMNNLSLLTPGSLDFFTQNTPNLLQPIMNNPLNLLSSNFGDLAGMNAPQQQLQQLQQLCAPQQSQSHVSIAIHENLRRYMGSLKFFDENKNYGFIVMDDDNRDIFVHYDDLQKAGITKEFLKSSKQGNVIRFSFSCMQYIGKYKQSKKAVELQVMPYNPALTALRMQQQFSYIYANPPKKE